MDLAILATREWSPLGITSLDVLEAPFLIDHDALALAVATSDVATEAMTGLEELGVTGLALWPEDLRHLFAFAASGKTFQTADDFVDATVLAIAGKPGLDLITTLGGDVYVEGVEVGNLTGDRVWDAESGELDGMVTGLWGAGLPPSVPATVAGDLVLYPKYQMLVANRESLARLSDQQRAALDAIVASVHEAALGRHFNEADLANSICERGVTVIEAGASSLAELRAAAQPLTDSMAADPLTGRLMDRVAEIAKATTRSPSAGTCEPSVPAVDAGTVASAPIPPGFTGTELVPDGTYRAEATAAELEAAGAGAFFASINAGVWTMTIDGDGWNVTHDKQNERCSGSQEAVDGSIRFATVVSQGCGMDYDFAWRLDGDRFEFRLVDLVWSDDPLRVRGGADLPGRHRLDSDQRSVFVDPRSRPGRARSPVQSSLLLPSARRLAGGRLGVNWGQHEGRRCGMSWGHRCATIAALRTVRVVPHQSLQEVRPMDARQLRPLAMIAAIALGAMAAMPASAQPGGGDADPVTLTLQTADTRDRQAGAAADGFVQLVSELSDGSITVEPSFGALSPATAVVDGIADLAMLPTRDWHALGVTSFDAFEAPFLIDSDALADAIARSPIANEAMAGLEAVGVTGLEIWPEDLRHLFAFEPSGKVFRTPADIDGASILVVAGQPGHDLITTLGGTIWQEGLREDSFTGDRHSDAISGALAGMVTGLWGAGLPGTLTVVASDIALFSKFQMLVANTGFLERLSPAQRAIVLEAAERTRESAIERRASESELGLRHCSNGGRVVHAGADALAELDAAAAPVDEALRGDPVTGALIADIEALKSEVPASAPAAPCEDASTIADESMFTDPTAYLGTIPPPGTYRAEITEEELRALGASEGFAVANAAMVTWVIGDDGTYSFEGVDGRCPGVIESKDGIVWTTEEPGHPCGVGGGFRWREVPEGIVMALPYFEGLSVRDVVDLKAFFERTWTRIESDAPTIADPDDPPLSEAPALGTYRIQHSVESLMTQGVDEATAVAAPGRRHDHVRW